MIQQAGIYRLDLYEAKGLSVTYADRFTIESISNTGDIISIENSDCNTLELNYTFEQRRSGNNNLLYKNNLNWKQLGLKESSLEIANTLKDSIYGWVSIIEFYNLDKKIILNPFIYKSDDIDNNISNHYNIEVENAIFGNRMFDYVVSEAEGIGVWEIENDFIVQ